MVTRMEQLTFGGFWADASWSPDGTKIAFARQTAAYTVNIFTANKDGQHTSPDQQTVMALIRNGLPMVLE